jgi:hypothetical protein
LKCAAEERSGTYGLNFVFGGLHYADILITWGELCLGGNFEVSVGSLAYEECIESWISRPNSPFALTKKAEIRCGGQSQDTSEPAVGHSNVCNFSAVRVRAVVLFLQRTDFCVVFLLALLDEEVIK